MNPIDEMRSDIREIKKILKGYIDGTYTVPKPSRRLTRVEIARVVSKFFNISVRQLKSDKRIDTIILARHISKYIMAKEFFYSNSEVAEYMNCKRANIYNSLTKVEGWMETDDRFRRAYKFCIEEVVRVSIIPI